MTVIVRGGFVHFRLRCLGAVGSQPLGCEVARGNDVMAASCDTSQCAERSNDKEK